MRVLPFLITKSKNSPFLFQKDKGQNFYNKLHSHPEIQITWIREGTGTIILNDYIGDFFKDDVIIIGSNVPHVLRNVEGEVESSSVFLDSAMLENHPFLVDSVLSAKLSELHNKGLKVKSMLREIQSTMNCLENSKGLEKTIDYLKLLNIITKAEYIILAEYTNTKKVTEREGDRLKMVYDYALTHYKSEVSLERAAEISNLTKSAFCRYFKQRTGKSFYELLTDLRISHSIELLKNPDIPIYEVGYLSGYNNLSNFNRKFKERRGITPSQYRRKLLDVR